MEEVIAGESVMSQSLFESPGAAGPVGGVLEQMAEGQEQVRAELGLVAERLEALEQGQEGTRVELERRQVEALAAAEIRPPRGPWIAALGALALAAAALLVALLR
jgi:hypothetical protein